MNKRHLITALTITGDRENVARHYLKDRGYSALTAAILLNMTVEYNGRVSGDITTVYNTLASLEIMS